MQTQLLADGMERLEQRMFRQFSPADQADERLVQKGLFLYRQGTVYEMGFDAGNQMLKAKVRDVHGVSVRISLNPDKGSSCSCPEEPWCRHRMAVFFKFYQQIASVSQWIQTWRNQKQDASVRAQKSPEAWRRLAETTGALMPFEKIQDDTFLMEHYILAGYRKFQEQAPVEKEWTPLYMLYISFYYYNYLAEKFDQESAGITRGLETIMEAMQKAVYDLTVYAHPFSFDPFFKELKADTARLLGRKDPLSFSIYGMMWFQLFTKRRDRELEAERLAEADQSDETQLAQTIFALLRNDDDFEEQFAESSELAVPHAVQWLEWLLREDEIDRSVRVLKAMQKKLDLYLARMENHSDRRSFSLWLIHKIEGEQLRLHVPDVTIKLYEKLLPYSARHLGAVMLDAGKYKEWVELVHWIDFTPEELEAAGLKKLMERKPEFAAPLLHQWVESLIQKKQRETYKKAVRYLKRLKKIYQGLNEEPRFELYLEQLIDRYRRLRAFREECERGKLIHGKD
ncbi:SWIM zinc finger family protein [Jeotgalibacillus haloalkalitolerans]|uniref:SWIM zinc finger family protein n=1 Tax=Jeotgalibacillus haloalkalitolerans TaxID=3104292 RepID=A0ABU5KJC0_9BACL|nr:SWIM zinc finger family protein [Jeotgalibacillus sp. HH7-29]MDZ5711272.1 SWIM zinc finger family protein [Jeotgalibacillus sp. HH7-29]